MGSWGSWPLKICRRDRSILTPFPPKVTFFHSNCKDERLVSKWKVKLFFWGAWNSLMAWPDWPDPHILRRIYASGNSSTALVTAAVTTAPHYAHISGAQLDPVTLNVPELELTYTKRWRPFLPRDAMRKRGLCCRPVSVRQSVTFLYCILTAEISSSFLLVILVLWLQISAITEFQGEPFNGASNARGGNNLRFSTEIAVYLGKFVFFFVGLCHAWSACAWGT